MIDLAMAPRRSSLVFFGGRGEILLHLFLLFTQLLSQVCRFSTRLAMLD
ncbi:MAG: hypothetical protein MZV63_08050 [Marinilabiliales bacterium]|nr:hypothetical protein [Marinilabiliales bacterium]